MTDEPGPNPNRLVALIRRLLDLDRARRGEPLDSPRSHEIVREIAEIQREVMLRDGIDRDSSAGADDEEES